MAADDDREQAPDPWDEIVAEGLGEGTGEISFTFDEPGDSAAADAPAAGLDAGDGPGPEASAAEDALVEHWLSGGDGEAGEAVRLDAPSEDHAAGSSAIEIGTGGSGVKLHGAPEQEEIGGGATDDQAAETWLGIDTSGSDDDAASTGGFPDISTAGAESKPDSAPPAPKTPARRPAKSVKNVKKKSGGIGQLVGVVLGGAMAIPITMAILIYGLGKDPFGVTKRVPEQVAFLLPEKFRPGYKKPVAPKPDADAPGPSALDDLPSVPATDTEPAPADVAGVDKPVMPDDPVPLPEPDPAPAAEPGLDDLAVTPAAAEPPPLDTAPLDDAVAEAAALCEAIGAVDDTGSAAYKTLRKRWYRALARVAEELVVLDNAAATSGRTVGGATDSVAALHGTIDGRELLRGELAVLACFWLAAVSRDSDGVVVPVTFESSQKVGPYWRTKSSLADAAGTSRTLTVISRTEPAAVVGDAVVVTGVALDREGTVIWAADIRAAGGGGLSAGF
ncbi:MAG: hypothetical protein ACKOZU_12505 [Planctomycetaceae bacterium]